LNRSIKKETTIFESKSIEKLYHEMFSLNHGCFSYFSYYGLRFTLYYLTATFATMRYCLLLFFVFSLSNGPLFALGYIYAILLFSIWINHLIFPCFWTKQHAFETYQKLKALSCLWKLPPLFELNFEGIEIASLRGLKVLPF